MWYSPVLEIFSQDLLPKCVLKRNTGNRFQLIMVITKVSMRPNRGRHIPVPYFVADEKDVVDEEMKPSNMKVDGRYVHWVAPWGTHRKTEDEDDHHHHDRTRNGPKPEPEAPDRQHRRQQVQHPEQQQQQPQELQRYSLIYYETGHAYVQPGPAVFSIPRHG